MVKKRTKALSTIFVALAAAVLLSMSMSVTYATTPMQVTWTSVTTGISVQGGNIAGESDNRFLTLSVASLYTGDIAGTSSSDSHWIIHNWVTGVPLFQQPGPFNAHGVDSVSTTFQGKSGRLTIMLNAIFYPSLGSYEGTWVIIGGTGELANLRGQGTILNPPGPGPSTWTGQVHFDP